LLSPFERFELNGYVRLREIKVNIKSKASASKIQFAAAYFGLAIFLVSVVFAVPIGDLITW
jgi:hypothetical protein